MNAESSRQKQQQQTDDGKKLFGATIWNRNRRIWRNPTRNQFLLLNSIEMSHKMLSNPKSYANRQIDFVCGISHFKWMSAPSFLPSFLLLVLPSFGPEQNDLNRSKWIVRFRLSWREKLFQVEFIWEKVKPFLFSNIWTIPPNWWFVFDWFDWFHFEQRWPDKVKWLV